ncbi:MAG: hypothetical protein M1820_009751 [Bogoriella megaspora]|nr:MAG: hypothetical protein M1820_009751 [Bogoriella megaspora]
MTSTQQVLGWDAEGPNLKSKVIAIHAGGPLVGTGETFFIHESYLTKSSEYFRAALRGPWQEQQSRVINFADEDAAVVKLYVQWAYTCKIYIRDECFEQGDPCTYRGDYERLVKAYAFGDKIQDVAFRDTLIDAIIALSKTPDAKDFCWLPIKDVVTTVYESTLPGSQLRQLMVDFHAWMGAEDWVNEDIYGEFSADLIRALWGRLKVKSTNPLVTPACKYHDHAQLGEPCYKDGR